MNEAVLIKLAQDNNRNALSQLLSSNYNIVYGYMLKVTKNDDLAKDITQDTMVKAITNINKFRGDSKFSTWLITIASNQFKNSIKKHNKMVTMKDSDLFSILEGSNTSMSIDDKIIHKESFILVLKELDNYKYKQKMPFILKHYYGYSYQEISIILKCPIGTVRSRIHNVIKKLQLKLKGVIHE